MAAMVASASSSSGSNPVSSPLLVQEKGSRNKRKFRSDPPLGDPNKLSSASQTDCSSFEFSAEKSQSNVIPEQNGLCELCSLNQEQLDIIKPDIRLSCDMTACDITKSKKLSQADLRRRRGRSPPPQALPIPQVTLADMTAFDISTGPSRRRKVATSGEATSSIIPRISEETQQREDFVPDFSIDRETKVQAYDKGLHDPVVASTLLQGSLLKPDINEVYPKGFQANFNDFMTMQYHQNIILNFFHTIEEGRKSAVNDLEKVSKKLKTSDVARKKIKSDYDLLVKHELTLESNISELKVQVASSGEALTQTQAENEQLKKEVDQLRLSLGEKMSDISSLEKLATKNIDEWRWAATFYEERLARREARLLELVPDFVKDADDDELDEWTTQKLAHDDAERRWKQAAEAGVGE